MNRYYKQFFLDRQNQKKGNEDQKPYKKIKKIKKTLITGIGDEKCIEKQEHLTMQKIIGKSKIQETANQ